MNADTLVGIVVAVTERMKDPTLDQASRDALDQIQTRMKQSIPSLR